MTRTPFIAGNWKMNKTIAEAEQYIQALLPQVAAVDGVEIVVCPPFLALAGARRLRPRLAGRDLRAEHARGRRRRLHRRGVGRRCCPRSTSQGVVLGHSERREYFNETDKALQLKVPKALETGLDADPLRRRDRGGARARRHRAQAAPPGPGGAGEGPGRAPAEVVVAYEPIWAIGTGKTATPDQAQEACSFIRALVANPDKAAAEQVRIVYGGSCKPDNAAELLALPDVDGALVGGASLDPGDFTAIVEAAARVTVPAVCLVVLDGWGLAPDGPGNAVALADTPVFDGLWAEHPHTTLTAKGEAVGLPDGQMGNSEVGHLNLGAGAIVPQDLARIDAAVRTARSAENETLRDALGAAERVHLIGLVSTGGVHSSEEHLKALIALAAELNVPDLVIHAFTDGRDTSPTSGARVGRRRSRPRAASRDRPRRARSSAATTRWTATSAGTAPSRRSTCSARARPSTTPTPARQAVKDAYDARRDRRVHHRHDGRRGGADPPRRRRAGLQLPPRPDAPDHDEALRGRRRLHDADVRTRRTGRSRSSSRRTGRRSRSPR